MVMVDDLEAAARNRERVKKKEAVEGYKEAEKYISHLSKKDKVKPQYQGEVPVVSRLDWEQFGGEQSWVFEDTNLDNPLEPEVGEIGGDEDTEDLTEDKGDVVDWE